MRDITRQVCHAQDIEILAGHVRPDNVDLLLSVPPTWPRAA
jgi:REP element-mobilizing transposase RayT